jgi:long-chain acyl-CoA synthetase
MPAVVPFETTPQLFRNLSGHFGGKRRTAVSYMDRRTREWTPIPWEELTRLVESMAGYLYGEGIRAGDRVAILSENRPEWAIADLATQLLGAVNVSLYTSLPSSQVAYILKDSGSAVLVTSTGIQLKKAEEIFDECPDLRRVVTMSELRKDHPVYVQSWDQAIEAGQVVARESGVEIRALERAVRPDDLSALIYTSGTTGYPKGVMLTHRNFCSNVTAALERVPFGPDDHHLSFLPLCHSFERTAGYLAVLACGARITYAQSIDTVSRDLSEVRPTVLISVPRLFERVYNVILRSVEEGPSFRRRIFQWAVGAGERYARAARNGRTGPVLRAERKLAGHLVFNKLHEKLGGNLRFAVSGGAALPRAVGEFFMAAGVTIIEGYGLTETAPVLTVNPVDHPRYGTVGHVLPGVTIGIQDVQNGAIKGLLRGEDYPSELSTVEGEIIARGPNIMRGYWNNETTSRESIDEDGWYHTGDVGRFDRGYLVITDRIKHMIVSKGGKNIYPGPIEELFKTETVIDQVMVVGEGREFLTALVVASEEAIRDLSAGREGDPLDSAALKEALDRIFRAYSRGAASHEKIRDFRIVREPFTVDNGMMTPTLKLRRRAIETQYADLIESMYADVV